jgi:hypothetical protein
MVFDAAIERLLEYAGLLARFGLSERTLRVYPLQKKFHVFQKSQVVEEPSLVRPRRSPFFWPQVASRLDGLHAA